MGWSYRILCSIGFAVSLLGCQSTERARLEDERRSLEFQRDNLRGTLNGAAPLGSRWDSHPDTHQFTHELNRIGAQIQGIDRQLMELSER